MKYIEKSVVLEDQVHGKQCTSVGNAEVSDD